MSLKWHQVQQCCYLPTLLCAVHIPNFLANDLFLWFCRSRAKPEFYSCICNRHRGKLQRAHTVSETRDKEIYIMPLNYMEKPCCLLIRTHLCCASDPLCQHISVLMKNRQVGMLELVLCVTHVSGKFSPSCIMLQFITKYNVLIYYYLKLSMLVI